MQSFKNSKEVGSDLISQLAIRLQPRYHFSGLEGEFYERQPYRYMEYKFCDLFTYYNLNWKELFFRVIYLILENVSYTIDETYMLSICFNTILVGPGCHLCLVDYYFRHGLKPWPHQNEDLKIGSCYMLAFAQYLNGRKFVRLVCCHYNLS